MRAVTMRDDDEIDIAARRRRRKQASDRAGISKALAFVSVAAWGTLFLAIVAGTLVYISAIVKSAPIDRVTDSGIFCSYVLALYVLARCVEKLTASAGRLLAAVPAAGDAGR